eukprot:jgi/Mesvir1/11252/Mv01057-RA.1
MAGIGNFKEQAIKIVTRAVEEDRAGNYEEAYNLYVHALDTFTTSLKYEKNPKIREAVQDKMKSYLDRAEQLKLQLRGETPVKATADGTGTKVKPGGKGDESSGGEDPETAKLRGQLGSAIMTEKPNVKWDDVAGLEGAKESLKEAVILPVKYPQFFTGKRKPWRGFLLYGPPGTGKSYLAKAVATEADSTFFSISSSDLVSKWMGESEKLVASLFNMAREKAPSIIFIDEIDSLTSQRGEGESEAMRRVKTEILVQMQGVSHDSNKVLILAATNMPYNLDQAVRRRFDKRIYIPLPDAKARAAMFKIHLGDTPSCLRGGDLDILAGRTEGFSGSDIAVVVKDVLFQPIRTLQDATHFKPVQMDNGQVGYEPCLPNDPQAIEGTLEDMEKRGLASQIFPPKISMMDFDKVLARARPTVSEKDLEVFERFTKEFGEEG